jgi:hypothetical protein
LGFGLWFRFRLESSFRGGFRFWHRSGLRFRNRSSLWFRKGFWWDFCDGFRFGLRFRNLFGRRLWAWFRSWNVAKARKLINGHKFNRQSPARRHLKRFRIRQRDEHSGQKAPMKRC